MSLETQKKVWDFIEENYPDYSNSQDIANLLDLDKKAEEGEDLTPEEKIYHISLTMDAAKKSIENHQKKEEEQFPNGFEDWHETHFEITRAISNSEHLSGSVANKITCTMGTGGLYELARDLTNKFEKLHRGKNWGIDEDTQYFDAIEEFLDKEL